MFPINSLGKISLRNNKIPDSYFLDRPAQLRLLFLYDKSDAYLKDELTNSFIELNNISGESIDIWTYYDPEMAARGDFHSEEELEASISQEENLTRIIKRNNGNITSEEIGYDNMALLADVFKCKGNLPTVVLWDSNNRNEQRYLQINTINHSLPLRTQLHIILDVVKGLECDWNKIVDYYHTPYSVIHVDESINSEIKKVVDLEQHGLPVKKLISEGYNEDVLTQISEGKSTISLKKYLYNFKALCCGNSELQEQMQSSVDRYLNYLKFRTKVDFPFPEIKQYLEITSQDYITRAFSIVSDIGSLRYSTEYSLAVYCLGKALEDEINLGAVHAIRKILNVHLPANYALFQERYYSANLDFIIDPREGKKEILNYNKKGTCKRELMYPKISLSCSLLFAGEGTVDYNNNSEMIIKIREELRVVFGDVYYYIRDIIDARNKAVHESHPLSSETYQNVINAYKKLIDTGFFQTNKLIKNKYSN